MKRAAQYLRVSSDNQRHSLKVQAAEIAEFAASNDYEIVRTYQDQGKSGLRLKGRVALQELLRDAMDGACGYEAVLVQDVSRWGRFQDADEAAHYEFLCRQAGLEIRYCAEPFDEFPGHTGDIFKAVKRLMAADFSRSLSAKTRSAQFRWAADGYKMGGAAGYGLRRALLGDDGEIKAILQPGEQRLLRTERVILVLGPAEEIAIVRRIFRLYLEDGIGLGQIAKLLNADGIASELGRPWASWTIGNLLANPKYAGDYLFGRRRRTLDGRRVNGSPEGLQRARNVLPAIVPRSWIEAAAAKRRSRMLFLPPDEIWDRLEQHVSRERGLSIPAIEADPELPSWNTCRGFYGQKQRILARLHLQPPPHLSGRHGKIILPGYIDSEASHGHLNASPDRLEGDAPMTAPNFTAFQGDKLLAAGDLANVALAARSAQESALEMPLVFDDQTGQVVDLDLRGSDQDVLRRLPRPEETPAAPPAPDKAGRGRPKLGVTAREVTLLPKHWEWLSSQPGGSSGAIRRLVEQAQKDNAGADAQRAAQTATYKVMHGLAGHLKGYEDALRALYANDRARFEEVAGAWPADVGAYVLRLSGPSFV